MNTKWVSFLYLLREASSSGSALRRKMTHLVSSLTFNNLPSRDEGPLDRSLLLLLVSGNTIFVSQVKVTVASLNGMFGLPIWDVQCF